MNENHPVRFEILWQAFQAKADLKVEADLPDNINAFNAYSETAGEHYLRPKLVIELSLLTESIKEL
jgi:hypothetical protein